MTQPSIARISSGSRLLQAAGWAWAALAGGGGIWYLATEGPWRLTNGWFALASGIAACPLTMWLIERRTRRVLPAWSGLAVAALFFVAGKLALAMGL